MARRNFLLGVAICIWLLGALALGTTLAGDIADGCGWPPNAPKFSGDSSPLELRDRWQWFPPGQTCEYRGLVYERPSAARGVATTALLIALPALVVTTG